MSGIAEASPPTSWQGLEDVDDDDPDSAVDGPQLIVDGQAMSGAEIGEMLKPYIGWSFELQLGGGLTARNRSDTPERISVRTPTAAAQRAVAPERAYRSTQPPPHRAGPRRSSHHGASVVPEAGDRLR